MHFESATQAVSAAIRSIFQRWTVLRLVVEHQLGGVTDEADKLMDETISMATSPSRRHDEDDFIDLFYDAFDRMQTDVEDGSPEEIASQIVRVRDAAARGDFGPATQLATKAKQTRNLTHLQSVDGGERFICGEKETELPQEPQVMIQEPVIDEDGFTEVSKGGKHR